ncbi:hypothetical protein AVEN_206168-1 [Araneus ventricosus]|uniref:Uncharacterized protein n=1 Tax=Araneus ventricosus TaxID=182803 RepID=A0A4Y2EDZ0_ARAVE|nr:hypothetical protein AVEN_206168-1 [Araneus ventricosus]
MDIVILNRGLMTSTTPELAHPNKSHPPHAGGAALFPLVLYRPYTFLGWAGPVWVFLHHTSVKAFDPPTYDLTCSRPNTRRIFSGIRLRTWNPPAQSRDIDK